jgi:hypothetical protein
MMGKKNERAGYAADVDQKITLNHRLGLKFSSSIMRFSAVVIQPMLAVRACVFALQRAIPQP